MTSLDLTKIILCDENGDELDNYNEVGIQKMDDTGAYLDSYSYATGFGWNVDYDPIAEGDVTFALGEAVCVNNDSGDTVYFRVSGEVDLVNQNTIATGYVLWGNSTPNQIDLTQVGIVDENGDELDTYNEIGLQKMDDTGAYLDSYSFATGFGWNVDYDSLTVGDVTLAPGESVCVNNDSGATVIFTLPSPISAQ